MFDRDRRDSILIVIGVVVALVVCGIYVFAGGHEVTGDYTQPSGGPGPQQDDPASTMSATTSKPDPSLPAGVSVGIPPVGEPAGAPAASKSSKLVPDSMLSPDH